MAGYSGILQADAHGGYGKLYEPGRTPGPILEAACWAHARRSAAVMYSLIVTAKMNGVDPQAWLADILARIADQPAHHLDDLLPWRWAASQVNAVDQAA